MSFVSTCHVNHTHIACFGAAATYTLQQARQHVHKVGWSNALQVYDTVLSQEDDDDNDEAEEVDRREARRSSRYQFREISYTCLILHVGVVIISQC